MVRDLEALDRYLAARAVMPFRYGSRANDCASHVAGAITAMTRRRPIGKLTWSTKLGAARVIHRGGGLPALMDARFTRIPPALAQRGDIAGVDHPDGIALLIVTGEHLVGPGGAVLPRSAMKTAWSAT